jgi:hypothetical protein
VNKTTAVGLGNDCVYSIYISGSTIYAGTDDGLSISTDGGASFVNKNAGLGSAAVTSVFVSGSGN